MVLGNPGPILGVGDRHSRLPPYDLRHEAAMAGIHVLHHHDDCTEVGRQTAQKLRQRGDAAGGGGDGDNVEGRPGSMRVAQSGLRLRPPCISATRICQ
jgi:hypothetical protein